MNKMTSFCADVGWQELHHVCGKKQRQRIRAMDTETREHYLFLYAASTNCTTCLKAWLARGKDPNRGLSNHPEWNALAWAEEAAASI